MTGFPVFNYAFYPMLKKPGTDIAPNHYDLIAWPPLFFIIFSTLQLNWLVWEIKLLRFIVRTLITGIKACPDKKGYTSKAEMGKKGSACYGETLLSSSPHQSRVFSLFLSYIIVTPLMLGFEKDFLCHFHLGLIRILPLLPFPRAPFLQNDKEGSTLELYYLRAYYLLKILLLQLVGHWVIQISRVFYSFPMLQLLYQFGQSRMDWLNILLGSSVLTLLCGIHSRLALGITSSSGWNSSQNLTTSPTSLPSTVSRTSIKTKWFHVLSLIGYFSSFVSLFSLD
ncbi:hypothetical protein Cgig2_028260 [Carnegiea gigantea]|uniref:Uncharacterized protein n=1 Tax=Carnegiea gigantea TaxID=171969 RepID=A0A9Q1JH28_9CARY|nr:hypothetical protein Cgig2_028260 [Carnegiea gigantea]